MKIHKDLILSIDIGTSSLKAGVFQNEGTMHAFRRYYYDKHQLDWASLEFLSDFISYFPQIGIISISAQSPSIVPLLQNGKTGRPLFYFQENTNLKQEGCPSVFLPKAAYHKKNFPDEYEDTLAYLSLGDYLVYLLTGQKWTSVPQEAYQKAVWTADQIAAYGLDKNKFPPFLFSFETAGYTKENLPCTPGTRVLGSTYDFLSALQGLDALHPGIAGDRSGSSFGLNFFFAEEDMPRIIEQKPLGELQWNIYPHVRERTFNAGVVFPDFDDFLAVLKKELREEDSQRLLKKILPSISPDLLHQSPENISQSFLSLWGRAKGKNAMEKAQNVFCDYARIIRFILHHWPLGKIKEIRCSGGPNENEALIQFKEKATGLPHKLLHVAYAELLGNVYRARDY